MADIDANTGYDAVSIPYFCPRPTDAQDEKVVAHAASAVAAFDRHVAVAGQDDRAMVACGFLITVADADAFERATDDFPEFITHGSYLPFG